MFVKRTKRNAATENFFVNDVFVCRSLLLSMFVDGDDEADHHIVMMKNKKNSILLSFKECVCIICKHKHTYYYNICRWNATVARACSTLFDMKTICRTSRAHLFVLLDGLPFWSFSTLTFCSSSSSSFCLSLLIFQFTGHFPILLRNRSILFSSLFNIYIYTLYYVWYCIERFLINNTLNCVLPTETINVHWLIWIEDFLTECQNLNLNLKMKIEINACNIVNNDDVDQTT